MGKSELSYFQQKLISFNVIANLDSRFLLNNADRTKTTIISHQFELAC